MINIRLFSGIIVAVVTTCVAASPSTSDNAIPPFQSHVDMKTFMEHVLSPAAAIIWKVNGLVIDEKGEHDLSPKSDDDWEQVVSGAATLAEATNALIRTGTRTSRNWRTQRTRPTAPPKHMT
jgi:hypothetical protein